MVKKISIIFLLISVFSCGMLSAQTKKDTLADILQMGQQSLKERILIFYLKPYFEDAPTADLLIRKDKTDNLLDKYNPDSKEAYKYFTQSICQLRLNRLDEAENSIVEAITQVNKKPDPFLLFEFYEYWGNIRAQKGNGIAAVYSYWLAKTQAIILNDFYSEAVLDIDISGLYYKSSSYNQSLFYLNQAQGLIKSHNLNDKYLLTLIYYNKAENFFRLNNADSLKIYDVKLKGPENVTYKIQTYRIRTDYYLQLLAHNYKGAIATIKSMMGGNKLFLYSALDKQQLANAYFLNGQTDSAEVVIDQLLKTPFESDNPEIKLRLYQQLATIAKLRKNDTLAASYNVMALKQSQDYINRLTQVNNMSSQMQLDEVESAASRRVKGYRDGNTMLLLGLIIAVMAGILIFLFYRNIRQKRLYESMLHRAEKSELAFINSHRVRKYMSNVLGLISVIRQSDEPQETFLESQDYLFKSAQQLDDAIKSISERLETPPTP